MRYAQIRSLDVTNGVGLGVALFVQGCHFHCEGCFNQETWDFNGGKIWDKETEQKFYALINKPHIKRVSLLGGEPLANENVFDIEKIVYNIKTEYPNVKIWLYTGYTLKEIYANKDIYSKTRQNIVESVDYLCDGRFEIDKSDPLNKELKWVGSTNQRVIDMKESVKSGVLKMIGE